MPPETIGHFRIVERLAAGGMGVVYRAVDERLQREVAIKLLPEGPLLPAAARERFAREARAVAALNHPHICTLYDIGEQAGRPYLVMELLEGESLHARLARGAVPLELAVQWAMEVADALQAAHAKGILHRDLKPGNIFITARGSAKVLDFGLAQIGQAQVVAAGDAPTLGGAAPEPLTSPGSTLGTLAYMPPEQARGEPTDARSDLFSLGVVLYETVTGRAPFRGRTALDVSAAILRETPAAPSTLRPECPPRLDEIVARCLEKDPELRYQSAADLRADLRRLRPASGSSSTGVAPPATVAAVAPPAPSSDIALARGLLHRHRRGALLAALVVVAGAVGIGTWRFARGRTLAAAWEHFSVEPVTNLGNIQSLAIAPDGKRLVYVAGGEVWLRDLTNNASIRLLANDPKHSHGAVQFSPDGEWIYFPSHTDGIPGTGMARVSSLGGTPQFLSTTGAGQYGGLLSPDGSRALFDIVDPSDPSLSGLMITRSDGGGATVVAQRKLPDRFVPGQLIAWSPDGRTVAAGVDGPDGPGMYIVLFPSGGGPGRRLGTFHARLVGSGAWLPDNSGLLVAAGNFQDQVWLLALPSGEARRVTNDVSGYSRLRLTRDGATLAAEQRQTFGGIWITPPHQWDQASLVGQQTEQNDVEGVDWLVDGSLGRAHLSGGGAQFWRMAADGSGAAPLTADDLRAGAVAADGNTVVLAPIDPPGEDLIAINSSGGGRRLLVPHFWGYFKVGTAWVAAVSVAKPTEFQAIPLAGGVARTITVAGYNNGAFALSPDDHWLAAVVRTPQGNRIGIYPFEQPAPKPTALLPVVAQFGWMPDSTALAFTDAGQIWSVPLDGGPRRQLTKFSQDYTIDAFAFSPDGRLAVSRYLDSREVVLLHAQR